MMLVQKVSSYPQAKAKTKTNMAEEAMLMTKTNKTE